MCTERKSLTKKSADGRMATEAAWLNGNKLTERRKSKCALTSTGLLMEGLIPPTSAKNDCTRRSRTWYTGPRRVFYVFNFVKLRLAVRCRARQRIRLHKHDRAGSCRRTQLSLKVGCLNSLREV